MMRVSTSRHFAGYILFAWLGLSLANAQAPPTTDQALAHLGLSKDRASLYKALRDSRPQARGIAAAELADMRDIGAIPLMVDAMTSEKNKQARFNIAESLNVLGSPVGTSELQSYCSNIRESFEMRMSAAIALSNTGNYECFSCVTDILESADAGLRQSALLYLSHISTLPHAFPSPLGTSLLNIVQHDPDRALRSLAVKIILQIGDQGTKTAYQHYADSEK